MTRVFKENGDIVPVSVLEVGPCVVVAERTDDKNGYSAIQVGFGDRREKLFTKPQMGQFKKADVGPKHYLREVSYEGEVKVGDELKVNIFKKGERVDITGISKGLGFMGAMRRHGFSGAQTTHGQSDRRRAPGSIGSSSYPSRVYKGMRMAGKMGKDKVTVLNLEVVDVIGEQNLMLVRGAIPGKKGGLVKIRATNRGRR